MTGIYCRTMYAFSGENDRALKFEVGEMIELLQPLDGGWWEGAIDGVRGWFPANYVKVLEKPVAPPLSAPEVTDNQTLPQGWRCYLSPDGHRYFVNSTTKETTWKRPSCTSSSSTVSPKSLLPRASSSTSTSSVNGCQASRSPALPLELPDLALQKASLDKQSPGSTSPARRQNKEREIKETKMTINGVTFPLPMSMPEQQLLKPNEWSYCDYFWTDKKDPQGGACVPGFEVLLQKQFKGKHLQKEMAEFIHERIKIEEEYAKNLSKLSQSPLAAQEEGTLGEAWAQLKKSLSDEAEVHLKFSSKLQSDVEKPLLTFRGDNFKKDLKKYEHSIADLRKQLLSRYAGVEKARKALADRQKDLEVKTQQLEIKLSNKTEEDIKKARRKSTQAGDDLMRCVDLYNQAQSKWFEEMVTSGLELERLEVERVEMIQQHLRQYTTLRHETDMFNQSAAVTNSVQRSHSTESQSPASRSLWSRYFGAC
ncbi:growth arrest-specific protein 7a isoform X2 [Alosa alosa]|uniref:growth arrest-specific protein 7a isoform X2 n=1 Tax=Alosa alosa TaxID=278164 RepID=UPI002015484E|nr:growth arrest-specific protein 7a isoform X2 [Alosa alosa]